MTALHRRGIPVTPWSGAYGDAEEREATACAGDLDRRCDAGEYEGEGE